MKNITYFMLFTLLMACKSNKKVTEIVSIKENVLTEKSNDNELLNLIASNHTMPEWFSSKASISANMNGSSLDVDAILQIRKDSAILIVVKKFGFEGARALITPDSVFIINRLEQSYDKMALATLAERFNMPPQFDAIQQLFVGNPTKIDKNKPFDVVKQDSTIILTNEKATIGASYTFLKKNLGLQQAFFEEEKNAAKMTMQYEDYKTIANKRNFSQQRKIDFFSPQSGNGEIEINFSDVEFNVAKTMRFQIPSHYQRKTIIKN